MRTDLAASHNRMQRVWIAIVLLCAAAAASVAIAQGSGASGDAASSPGGSAAESAPSVDEPVVLARRGRVRGR